MLPVERPIGNMLYREIMEFNGRILIGKMQSIRGKYSGTFSDVLMTVYLSIILVINQLNAQPLVL